GDEMSDEDWQDRSTRTLGMFLAGKGIDDLDDDGDPIHDDDLLLLLSSDKDPVEFKLPDFRTGPQGWEVLIDTNEDDTWGRRIEGMVPMAARSLLLLRRVNDTEAAT
ncbi:MAG TPA: hypothetical protein VGB85_20580, partial [Nannocystis sp.]